MELPKGHASFNSNLFTPNNNNRRPERSVAFGKIPLASILATQKREVNNSMKHEPLLQKPTIITRTNSNNSTTNSRKNSALLSSKGKSLWMKTAEPLILSRTRRSELKKKLLRLLLVFSYLLSISLFAIALATFYGFFWTAHIPPTSSDNDTFTGHDTSTIPHSESQVDQ
ncbi:unnamed protein product [Didymodactylos carnosus]|uniref:Uncharacterized protein n=1 Tax=Didymodactylos carnosus TaxID=1234261 RepID=A0A813NW77_9BILA|nr:unnamed protein product [Didymodactylos carnosus]CAF0744756.1 unnamed protein product [Didymodactylos carnosus]CAF3519908.1 unnamed protein product [Didymodactylos carnosus]CAF3522654.1 unnamed protein product [Didymodactylos carnosus]